MAADPHGHVPSGALDHVRARLRAVAAPIAARMRRRAEAGTSAVEFALIAPVLVFALLSAVDIAAAEYERMSIDHALRAGAQNAMADPGDTAVLKVLKDTASKNFTLAATTNSTSSELAVSALRFCACPDSPNVAVACSQICALSAPPAIFYGLNGNKVYRTTFLPAMRLNLSLQVQVR